MLPDQSLHNRLTTKSLDLAKARGCASARRGAQFATPSVPPVSCAPVHGVRFPAPIAVGCGRLSTRLAAKITARPRPRAVHNDRLRRSNAVLQHFTKI